jgi:hypothetical protein
VIGIDQVPSGALVVLPEIWPEYAKFFPSNRCALWWLSVDNFGSHGQTDLGGIDLHLCQSEYAWRHVYWKVGSSNRLMLTDWVDLPEVTVERRRRVVVNPAKDAGLLNQFRSLHRSEEFGFLGGLDRLRVAELFGSSDVYIDFGRHPGRDRAPREAALAGCVVLSVALGAARLFSDMPIDDCYKFDSLDEACAVLKMVRDDWSYHAYIQETYRSWVAGQGEVFRDEVRVLLERVS